MREDMEKKFQVVYGHMRIHDKFYTDFVCTEENANVVARAIAKGQDADWCYVKDYATGKEEILWDCM